ncbi:hypothetical protein ABPG75_009151 [Micractinium tetrahymenae]
MHPQLWQDLRPLMAALEACGSCAEVLQLIEAWDREAAAACASGVRVHLLVKALDSMAWKAAGRDRAAADRQAVAALLQLAARRLAMAEGFPLRLLVAYIRCSAAFLGLLQPEQLELWLAALRQQLYRLPAASARDISAMLLALGMHAKSAGGQLAVLAGHSGQQLTAALLRQAVALAAQGALGPRDATDSLAGAANLGLPPDAAQFAALLRPVELEVGCAMLAAHPGTAVIQACLDAVEKQRSAVALAHVTWDVAALEAQRAATDAPDHGAATWARLVELVRDMAAELRLPHVPLQQLARAHQLTQPHGMPGLAPELLQRSQQAVEVALEEKCRALRAASSTSFVGQLAAAVSELAGDRTPETTCIVRSSAGEGLTVADIAVPELRIAVQADGPRRFLHNRCGPAGCPQPTAYTLARTALLRAHGWHVVSVPVWACQHLFQDGAAPSNEQLVAELQRYLLDHTDLAAVIAQRSGAASAAA